MSEYTQLIEEFDIALNECVSVTEYLKENYSHAANANDNNTMIDSFKEKRKKLLGLMWDMESKKETEKKVLREKLKQYYGSSDIYVKKFIEIKQNISDTISNGCDKDLRNTSGSFFGFIDDFVRDIANQTSCRTCGKLVMINPQ